MEAVGTKMERMKRARRNSVKLAMVGNGDHEGQSVVCGAGVVAEDKQDGNDIESELVVTTRDTARRMLDVRRAPHEALMDLDDYHCRPVPVRSINLTPFVRGLSNRDVST